MMDMICAVVATYTYPVVNTFWGIGFPIMDRRDWLSLVNLFSRETQGISTWMLQVILMARGTPRNPM